MAKANIKISELAEILEDVAREYEETGKSLVKAEASDDMLQPKADDVAADPAPEAPPAPAEEQPMAPEQDGELSVEALQAEYAQLSPDELNKHKEALMAALSALEAPAPEAAPAEQAPPPEMAKEEDDKEESSKEESKEESKAEKAELKANPANGGKIKKSEDESEELKGLLKKQAELIKAQQADMANMGKALDAMLERPTAKAITSLDDLQKSELKPEPSKADVEKMLVSKIPDLTKKERDLVAKYFLGKVSVEALASVLSKL